MTTPTGTRPAPEHDLSTRLLRWLRDRDLHQDEAQAAPARSWRGRRRATGPAARVPRGRIDLACGDHVDATAAAPAGTRPPSRGSSPRDDQRPDGPTCEPRGDQRPDSPTCEPRSDQRPGGLITDPSPAVLVIRVPGCLSELPRHVPVELLAATGRHGVLVASLGLRPADCPSAGAVIDRFADLVALLPERLHVVASGDDVLPAPPHARRGRGEGENAPVVDADHLPLHRRAMFGLGPASESSTPPGPSAASADPPAPERVLSQATSSAEAGGDSNGSDRDPFARPDPSAAPDAHASEHARLVAAMTTLLAGAPRPADPPGPGILLRAGRGERQTGCTACRVCVSTCPEGALDLRLRDDVATLSLAPARCSGCRLCLDACPEDVLTLWRPARWSEQLQGEAAIPLATVHTSVCDRCGVRFAGRADDVCEVCAFRIDRPFGSHLPPAAREIMRRNASAPPT